MTMPPCKVTALFEIMQYGVHRILTMFGLLESCKLNKVNFGQYIEDILTRILCCEEVDASFLPCDYVRHFKDGTDAEVTKTSQASLDG